MDTVSLGFTDQSFPAGVHVCQIISHDDERQDSIVKFLAAGVLAGERSCCFSDDCLEPLLEECFVNYGISYDEAVESGLVATCGSRSAYCKDNRFDPDRMIRMLREYYEHAVAQGHTGARMIGEMHASIGQCPGGDRLLEYEARVGLLVRECPVTAVCQYDTRKFDGKTIMDVLRLHPWMVVRGSVVHNPFHVPPEEFLRNESRC